MNPKANLNGLLFVYSSQAAYNTYQDLYESNNAKKLLPLDITDFSGYSVARSKRNIKEIKIYDAVKKFKIPHLLKQVISLFLFRKKLSKIVRLYGIKHIIIEIDKEPLYLMIISFCNRHSIKTTCFQHGLYQSDSEEYETEVYKKRFSKAGYILYKFMRKLLHILHLFPERKSLGKNGATQYFFYSDYYRDMFVKSGVERKKIKIVGPTKYALLSRGNQFKKGQILYGNMFFEKWCPHLNISDEVIFKTIINNIPDNFDFIIKPHPAENKSLYESCFQSKSANANNVIIVDPGLKVEDLLNQSKILITCASSIIYDAIFFDTLVVILDLSEIGLSKLEETELFSVTLDEIRGGIIRELIENRDMFNDLLDRQKEFFDRHLGNNVQQNIHSFIKNITIQEAVETVS